MIHESVVLFGKDRIKMGKNVRIDCFCMISAGPEGIEIGDNVHLGVSVKLFGSSEKIIIGNFCSVSAGTTIYSGTDEFCEGYLIGAMLDEEYRKVYKAPVILEDHVAIGSNCVILPGVTLGRGSSVGALSLIKKDVNAYDVVVGTNQRVIAKRSKSLIDSLEHKFMQGVQW